MQGCVPFPVPGSHGLRSGLEEGPDGVERRGVAEGHASAGHVQRRPPRPRVDEAGGVRVGVAQARDAGPGLCRRGRWRISAPVRGGGRPPEDAMQLWSRPLEALDGRHRASPQSWTITPSSRLRRRLARGTSHRWLRCAAYGLGVARSSRNQRNSQRHADRTIQINKNNNK